MAPLLVDAGGDTLCVKYVRTGYNNPGSALPGATLSAQTINSGASLTLTADSHLGALILLNSATGAITLPAATGTGNTYTIFVTVASTNATITAAGSDKIAGCAIMGTVAGTSPTAFGIATGTTITMNGTTKGGVVGSIIYLTDVASALWALEANLVCTAVTPVSPLS